MVSVEEDDKPCTTLSFTLNGKAVSVENPDPSMLLIEYIRDVQNLKGTKHCCNEGGCGACTVLLGKVPVNACLRPLCSMSGQSVTTIEVTPCPPRYAKKATQPIVNGCEKTRHSLICVNLSRRA